MTPTKENFPKTFPSFFFQGFLLEKLLCSFLIFLVEFLELNWWCYVSDSHSGANENEQTGGNIAGDGFFFFRFFGCIRTLLLTLTLTGDFSWMLT
jgi:hypothetical protein